VLFYSDNFFEMAILRMKEEVPEEWNMPLGVEFGVMACPGGVGEDDPQSFGKTFLLHSPAFNLQSVFWMIMLAAVKEGDAKKLAALMRQDSGFKVNMDQNGGGLILLHHACVDSKRSAVIPLLLAHPDIDVNVNKKDLLGWTPFYRACVNGHPSCVHEMLKDSRVKVNEPNNDGRTPLWCAARSGHLDAIRWWIAFGTEMDLGTPGDIDKTDAIGVAKMYDYTKVVTLLERFKDNPVKTRHAMKVELGFVDDLAAEVFALVVFVSDGLLQIKDTTSPSSAARFFNIARRLPLELQMMLCHRQVGSDKEIIPGKDSEVAFKALAGSLLWTSFFTN